MQEAGIDLSHAEPRYLTSALASTAYLLVTMGCGEECPLVPGVERDDWPLEDPKGQPLQRVREIRDEIRKRVVALSMNANGGDGQGLGSGLRAQGLGLKTSRVPLGVTRTFDRRSCPARLASYKARSALFISVSASSPCTG